MTRGRWRRLWCRGWVALGRVGRHRPDVDEACAAHADATRKLRQVRAQAPEVADLAAALRAHREMNHFADMIGNAMKSR